MVKDETEAFATRLPPKEADLVLEAIEETDLTRASLLKQALQYYIDENPDNIPAFRDLNHTDGPLEKAGILSGQANEGTLRRRNLDHRSMK